MTKKGYFLAMLFAPLILPFSTLIFGESLISGVLILSLGFGGIPYLFFIVSLLLFTRKFSFERVKKLSYVAPFMFIPFQIIFLIINFFIDQSSNSELTGIGGTILVSGVYVILLGYAYVLLVNIGYVLLNKGNSFKA